MAPLPDHLEKKLSGEPSMPIINAFFCMNEISFKGRHGKHLLILSTDLS